MKKIWMVMFSLGALYSESIVSTEKELREEAENVLKLNELENLKSLELNQTKKSILLFENNPLVQSLLMKFLKNIMENAEGKFGEVMTGYSDKLSNKIRTRIREEIRLLKMENEKEHREALQNQENIERELKLLVINEIKKIKKLKKIIEENQKTTNRQMKTLKNVFQEVQDKMDSYTKYIDSKFNLRAVKDIELSRVFLIKDFFPIKYIKNFNSKTNITVVMNSDKEYGINSMITERCRIEKLTNKHITIECIDANDNMYKNRMNLEITKAKNDYILNAMKKSKNGINDGFEETSTNDKIDTENIERNIQY